MDVREEIVALISLGYQSRNLIESQVADYHAERLMEMWEAAKIYPRCGAQMEDELAGTIWSSQ